jgi:hypothetical protein
MVRFRAPAFAAGFGCAGLRTGVGLGGAIGTFASGVFCALRTGSRGAALGFGAAAKRFDLRGPVCFAVIFAGAGLAVAFGRAGFDVADGFLTGVRGVRETLRLAPADWAAAFTDFVGAERLFFIRPWSQIPARE